MPDYSKQRDDFISSKSDVFISKVKKWEQLIWSLILEQYISQLETDENGKVKQNTSNIRKLSVIDQIQKKTNIEYGANFAQSFVKDLGSLFNLNKMYFSGISDIPTFDKVADIIRKKLSLTLGIEKDKTTAGGYVESLFGVSDPMAKIKREAIKAIAAGTSLLDFQKMMSVYIQGGEYQSKKKQGIIQGHMRTNAYDAYAQFDRLTGNEYALALGLNYAVYNGGLVEDSRQFCIDRNGKVFTRDQIMAWVNVDFKEKWPNYDPIRDCGCWRCRHKLDWISNEMGERLLKRQNDNPTPAPTLPDPIPAESSYVKATTIKQARDKFSEMMSSKLGINISKVQLSSQLSLDQLNERLEELSGLLDKYKTAEVVKGSDVTIQMSSTKRAYGFIKSYPSGKLTTINFGHKFDLIRAKGRDIFNTKSAVDEKNQKFATIYHEFAHVISIQVQSKTSPTLLEYWKELISLRNDYSNELRELNAEDPAKAKAIYLGAYASTNANEFMAEAFTEYSLHSKPSKYALLVGKLIDKYFKK